MSNKNVVNKIKEEENKIKTEKEKEKEKEKPKNTMLSYIYGGQI